MLVIHIFHVLAKLSTLKRSRLEAIFALKHSRFCAETLPLTIYAFIYLYKSTCSWHKKTVDMLITSDDLTDHTKIYCLQNKEKCDKSNYLNKKYINTITLFFLITLNSVLSGCQKVIYIHDPIITPVSVTQKSATNHQPVQFYVCGNNQYPCARKIVFSTTMKDPVSVYSFKQKGVVNENHVTQKNAVCQ